MSSRGAARPGAREAKLTASDAASQDLFGHSVSISGDTVVVGSLRDDLDTNGDGTIDVVNAGSAYVFQKENPNSPPIADDSSFDLLENSVNGTFVGNVSATDPDGDPFTYSVTGGSGAGAFDVDANSGQISVADSSLLDYEAIASLTLDVLVDDGNGGLDTATITVALLNETAIISGTVFVDVDGDGLFDGGTEIGIDGVTVTLYESDGVTQVATDLTSMGGAYAFTVDDEKGTYRIVETQPTGVDDGGAILGDANGNGIMGEAEDGSVISTNEMQVTLIGAEASDYDFTETGQAVSSGDTASIGFWQNKHGQALIEAGGDSLAGWLTENFGNIFGNSFSDGVGGDDGAEVADFYKREFFKKKLKGTPKVDAQFMGLAFATYFTSSNLSGATVASDFGFNVTETGLGTKVVNLGETGDAFNAADYTDMAIMALLVATNDLTGADADTDDSEDYSHVYDADGDGTLDATELALREMANELYTSINEGGEI